MVVLTTVLRYRVHCDIFAKSGHVMLQGCLVTLCVDSSLHLWQLNVRDGESFIEEVKYLSAETRLVLIAVHILYASVSQLSKYCNVIRSMV